MTRNSASNLQRVGGDHYLHFRYFTFHLLYTAWGIVYYNGRMYFFVMQGSLYRVDDRKHFLKKNVGKI